MTIAFRAPQTLLDNLIEAEQATATDKSAIMRQLTEKYLPNVVMDLLTVQEQRIQQAKQHFTPPESPPPGRGEAAASEQSGRRVRRVPAARSGKGTQPATGKTGKGYQFPGD